MPQEIYKRKLTAILSADAAGYSRLMGDNESETIKTLTTYRKVMGELIQQHRGRVVDSPGDNILAEFVSVVDAVQCAVAAQNELKSRNAELSENRRMEFRIGINLGDVIEEENRIYGDGVNIAARLEALADPGGICISKTAFDQIETKLPLGYEYLGEKEVKNIARPVGAYRVQMEPRVTVAGIKDRKVAIPVWRRKGLFAGALAPFIVIIGLVMWNFYFRPPPIEPASKEKMAFPLPDKPSIAVLPFVNISEDPKQEFFCDGMTEEIINALSKVPQVLVIARNSTFVYKGKAVKVRQVAEELGVQYVLHGSIRRSGDLVRITIQLIDAIKGHNLWSERYDQSVKDILALQDEITMKILTELRVKLTEGETSRIQAKGTKNLQAYLKVLEGDEYRYRNNKESNAVAKRLFQEAVALDPNYPMAHIGLAKTHSLDVWLGATESPKNSIATAIKLTQKAIEMDNSVAEAHAFLGYLLLMIRQHDKAIEVGERAVALNPNSASAAFFLAMSLNFAGKPEESIPFFQRAIRLNPFAPNHYHHFGAACRETQRYEEAIAAQKKALKLAPNDVLANLVLTSVYMYAGREKEAHASAAEVLRIDPNFSVEKFMKVRPDKDPARTARFKEALSKAGLK